MKKWLLLSLCLVGFKGHATTILCHGEEVSLTIKDHKVSVQFADGGSRQFSYHRTTSQVSPFTWVTTYHLITRQDAQLVTSERVTNSRIPNCGRRVCDDDHWDLSKITAKFSLSGSDYLLACYETF